MAPREREGAAGGHGGLRVLVADDEALVRLGIRCAVKTARPDLVVDEVAHPSELAAAVAAAEPDIVLLDEEFGDRSPAEILPAVREQSPKARVIVLGRNDDLSGVRRAFAAGAAGYVPKEEVRVGLLPALETVASGGLYLEPHLGAALASAEVAGEPRTRLTDQERQVLELVAGGLTSREVAARLDRSVRTVEGIRTRAQHKLELADRAALIERARVHAFGRRYRAGDRRSDAAVVSSELRTAPATRSARDRG